MIIFIYINLFSKSLLDKIKFINTVFIFDKISYKRIQLYVNTEML